MIEVAGACLAVAGGSKAFPLLKKASLQLFVSTEYHYTVWMVNDGMIVSPLMISDSKVLCLIFDY